MTCRLEECLSILMQRKSVLIVYQHKAWKDKIFSAIKEYFNKDIMRMSKERISVYEFDFIFLSCNRARGYKPDCMIKQSNMLQENDLLVENCILRGSRIFEIED